MPDLGLRFEAQAVAAARLGGQHRCRVASSRMALSTSSAYQDLQVEPGVGFGFEAQAVAGARLGGQHLVQGGQLAHLSGPTGRA